MKYALLLLIFSFSATAQKTELVDFSHRINSANKVPAQSKRTQKTVREYNAALNGTLIVTGYVDENNILVSSVKLEVARGVSARKAALLASSDCTNDICEDRCRNKSEVTALICMGSCVILCR